MLINETCDLSCSLALPFHFQLAGKNSYFLNNSTETKTRKQGAFVAIKTHGRPPALANSPRFFISVLQINHCLMCPGK